MHSLTPVTPPTTDLPALRTHRREGREGWLRPVEVYAVQVQWNQASIPSFNRRRPALMWKYSTHSAAFKVRSHTPARTMTHAVLRLLPPPPSQPPLSGGWSRANEHRRACISTSVIELRFRGRRPPMGRRSTLCGCRQGDLGRGEIRIFVNEFRENGRGSLLTIVFLMKIRRLDLRGGNGDHGRWYKVFG